MNNAGQTIKKVVVRAPAKLNLALDVTGLTPDGYHTLDMIMQAVTLYEEVEIARSSGYSLRCPQSRIPSNDKNTATRAASVFFTETGLLAGADITVHKKVPVRAGMAGGSADAAAVLVGLNELYNARLPLGELARLGTMVGADVPFSLLGGTARVGGIGNLLQPLPPLPCCWFVVGMPRDGVSTPAAFARYDQVGSPVHPNIDAAATAVQAGDLAGLAGQMQNALEYASGDAQTASIRRVLDENGALASLMTGSGAAVYGLFAAQMAAENAAEALRTVVPQVFVVQPDPCGPQVVGKG